MEYLKGVWGCLREISVTTTIRIAAEPNDMDEQLRNVVIK